VVDPNPARGMPLQLQRYWLLGKGAAKIRWNVPGDFNRCVRALAKYFPKDPKGLCNILHTKATGGPPGHGSAEKPLHHSVSVDTPESLTAASALLAAMPALGKSLWAGPLAPIGRPTGEPTMQRIFDPGALRHRTLPLPLNHRRVTAAGHQGSVTVGRILGITYGPDENSNEYCWAWGDYLDPSYVPEVKEARYLVDQGVAGPSLDPGGQVIGALNPDTGMHHMAAYTIGGATLVSIPAFAELHLSSWDNDMDEDETLPEMGEDMPQGMYNFDLDDDCGCDQFTVNPPGWRGLPLATREAVFDNDDAVKRIAAWSGIGTDAPDINRMKRAFMWHDSRMPETDPTSYRLPIGDIINGKLTLMYHAIYAAAALISGAHGGLPGIDDSEKNQLRRQITEIYQSMAHDFGDSSLRAPWDRPMDDNQGASFAMADNKPYGDVAYADPGYQDDKKKRYPIDTAEHVRAAWSYINQKGNAGEYSPEPLKSMRDRIMAAAKKLGVEIAEGGDRAEYSIPLEPPGWWFEDPQLPGKTPLTVEPNGRIYGHLAAWNECHRDVGNRECVLAPHSKLGYRPFHLGTVRTAEGETLQVGKIVQDTRHAGINLGYMSAAIHYDNTGDEAGVVRAGEDEYGIWVAGAAVPEATPKKLAKLRRSPLSGDWRRVEGNLELTAALAVNVPAFPVYAMEGDERTALTAAGTVYPEDGGELDTESEAIDLYAMLNEMAAQEREEDDGEQQRERRRQWLDDILQDEQIYAQRDRARRLDSLRAAAEAPAAQATAPAAAAATPVQAAGPAPAQAVDQGQEPIVTPEQEMLARQMNASFSVVGLPDGRAVQAGTTPPDQTAPAAAPAAPAPNAPAPPAQE